MHAAHFAQDEFDALNASLAASNSLAAVELEVMECVAPRIARGLGSTYFSDIAPEQGGGLRQWGGGRAHQ